MGNGVLDPSGVHQKLGQAFHGLEVVRRQEQRLAPGADRLVRLSQLLQQPGQTLGRLGLGEIVADDEPQMRQGLRVRRIGLVQQFGQLQIGLAVGGIDGEHSAPCLHGACDVLGLSQGAGALAFQADLLGWVRVLRKRRRGAGGDFGHLAGTFARRPLRGVGV